MDNLEIVKEKFKNDKFAKLLDIELDELTDETIKMHMRLKAEMNNFYDRPHGGAIYALADAAFSVTGNNKNNISVALGCSINYHTSPNPGQIIYVEGQLIHQTNKIGTYNFLIFSQENGKKFKIATMIGTLYRTGKAIDPKLKIE